MKKPAGLRRRLTYANVISTLALFFALTGGAMAGAKFLVATDTIPASSDLAGSTYGDPQIAAGKVTTDKLADGAITSSKFDSSALAPNADKLDGLDSSAFAAAGSSYTKSESDGRYLGINGKAADSNQLDGLDSSSFAQGVIRDTGGQSAGVLIGSGTYLAIFKANVNLIAAPFSLMTCQLVGPSGVLDTGQVAVDNTQNSYNTQNGIPFTNTSIRAPIVLTGAFVVNAPPGARLPVLGVCSGVGSASDSHLEVLRIGSVSGS